jgi:hypothetical protein
MGNQCPIHEGDTRCRNQIDPNCTIFGLPGQGQQLQEFSAEICRHHYAMLDRFHSGISISGKVDPQLRN